MAYDAPVEFEVRCPRCAARVCAEKVSVEFVSVADGDGYTYVHVQIGQKIRIRHECVEPTDGLQPIERFVAYGVLDDMGKVPL